MSIERNGVMNAEMRRNKILSILSDVSDPISATVLAQKLNVSRQVIVNDVAILRASGSELMATPRGYILQGREMGIIRQIACIHDAGGMRDELNAIVDQGCKVIDVVVEHPVYGQLAGTLQLSNRNDVKEFVERSGETQLLSHLTGGVHLHTVLCPTEEAFERVKQELRKMKVLL